MYILSNLVGQMKIKSKTERLFVFLFFSMHACKKWENVTFQMFKQKCKNSEKHP